MRLMQRLRAIFTLDMAGMKLNLLTLNINDKQATNDYESHKKHYQNNKNLYMMLFCAVTVNLLMHLYWKFVQKVDDTVGLIGAGTTFIILAVLWGVSRNYCQRMSKYIFIFWYLLGLSYNIASAVSEVG